jgi:plastocyanin
MRRILALGLMALAVTAAACGSGTSPSDVKSMATCSPSGSALKISAQNLTFDTKCLAAPAGQPFTITLDNQENGIPHNVAIYQSPSRSKVLFQGKVVVGVATVTYQVKALPPGTYYFQCDVHPAMNGAFVVR